MLDYLRNWTKSKEEKRQEALNAYLDDALAPEQRQQVESELAQDEALRVELDQMRLLQQQMRQLPRRRVRRNFVLDPALYGRPQREPLVQAYPVLRTATALAAFFFIFAFAANLFLNNRVGMMPAAAPAMIEQEAGEALIAEAVVEEAEAEPMAMEEPAEESLMFEEMAVDPEFEKSADEAGNELELLEMDSEAAAPLESAASAEGPKTESLVEEDRALAAAPTMAIEGTEEAELTAEQQALPKAAATELAMQPGPRSAEESRVGDDASIDSSEIQTPRAERAFWTNSMGLIVLFLGIVFVILIVLTLLARRRL